MDVSDITKIEIKDSLCVYFTSRSGSGLHDECTIKYSDTPHPDFTDAWMEVRDVVMGLFPEEWKDSTDGILCSISKNFKKNSGYFYSAKIKLLFADGRFADGVELNIKNIPEFEDDGLSEVVSNLWDETIAYINGKRAQIVLQFDGGKQKLQKASND